MGDRKLQQVYDGWSLIYDKDRINSYFKDSLNIVLKNIPRNSTILDVGCGTGMYCIELAKMGYRIKGFDGNENMVKKAIENAAREGVSVDFAVADAEEKVPFTDKFDFAICLGSWEYFKKPVDALNNIYQSLAPEGHFVIVTANPYFSPLIILAEKLKIKTLAPTYVYFNSFAHRVKKWVNKTSFTFEKKEHSYHYFNVIFHLKKHTIKRGIQQ